MDWVHIVEREELIPFLRRQEIIITTGMIGMKEDEWLQFCTRLHEKSIGALVVNIGPYVQKLPISVLEYCDANSLPLFVLPWEIRLVDLTHEICRLIVKNEQVEEDLSEAFYNAILYPEKRKECQVKLSYFGYGEETVYQLLAFWILDGEEQFLPAVREEFETILERLINQISNHYILMREQNTLYLALINYHKEDINRFMEYLMEVKLDHGFCYYCAVDTSMTGLEHIAGYYEKADTLLKLAVARKQQIAYYDNLDIYKVLLAVEDNSVRKDLCKRTIQKVIEYDQVKGTHLYDVLVQYFQNNGSVQNVAKDNYVHRNTVNYQLKKIEGIMGVNLENWEDRLKIHMAILMKDIL